MPFEASSRERVAGMFARMYAGTLKLVDPAGADPASEAGKALAELGVPESNIGVFPSQTAAWAAAADGAGVAPAVEHLVSQQLRRGELSLA